MATEAPYTFDQTLQNVTVTCPLNPGTSSKLISVEIGAHNLSVKYKSSPDYLFQGQLHDEVIVDDSTWSIIDKKELVIHLEKKNNQQWWPCVIKGHPEIDVTKLQPENSKLSDLDDETRATVEKMMVEQRQKLEAETQAKSVVTPAPENRANKRAIFEQFKAQHPELDFSKVDMSSIQ